MSVQEYAEILLDMTENQVLNDDDIKKRLAESNDKSE